MEFFAVLPVVALHVVKDAGRHVIIVNLYCKLKQGIHQLLVILMQAGEILLAEILLRKKLLIKAVNKVKHKLEK